MAFFATTVFLSAFLLFQIQPLIAKMILPWFGGSSSVWSTCMVFFQLELLLGYAYVHWLHVKLPGRKQIVVHAVLLLASLAMLPVAANPMWRTAAQSYPVLSVLAVLAMAVGAPYLMLSTTGPLMQAWYVRTLPLATTSAHPYRLYALSNFASMLALISYPVVVEPVLPVGPQSVMWSAAYALFVLSCLATARLAWKHMEPPYPGAAAATTSAPVAPVTPAPTWRDALVWTGLAAAASTLLLALTRHMTQDVAPVPFLWVLPLTIYLLSFILCFDAPRYYVRPLFLAALPLALLAMDAVLDGGQSVMAMVALISASLFVFCMVCHGELVRRRPDVRHLTLFYLMLSVGGALGGVLVGLVAPAVFTAYFELPIGLFLCAALVVVVVWRETGLRTRGTLWRGLLLLALAGYGWRLADLSLEYVQGYRTVVRNFYSQLRVSESDVEGMGLRRMMRHGKVTHGEQYMEPARRAMPTAYYCEKSGIGRALRSLQSQGPLNIGVVGLGAGTLAAYGRAGDNLRFYEINDQVLDLARSEFTYLGDSKADITHVLGDGRLMLEKDVQQPFDLLAMDAFSGDSIPTHLLTMEAMRMYFRHLTLNGVLAVHITNRYLDLQPVIAAAAQRLDKVAMLVDLDPDDADEYCRHSTWVLLMSRERLVSLPQLAKDAILLNPRAGFKAWSDDFSNLYSILK